MKRTPKDAALAHAKTTQGALNKAEKAATEAAEVRNLAVYDAQAKGATYPEIRAATGLSIARIAQVLARVRKALAASTTAP